MFYVIEWPTILRDHVKSSEVVHIVSSEDSDLFLVCTHQDLIIYHQKTLSQVLKFRRHADCIEKHGLYTSALWKWDSSIILLTTDRGFILGYKLEPLEYIAERFSLNSHDDSSRCLGPSDPIKLSSIYSLNAEIASICSAGESVIVASRSAELVQLSWNGSPQGENISLTSFSFCYDMQNSRASGITDPSVFCRSIEWAPTLGGVVVLLSSDRIALLRSKTYNTDEQILEGIWAEDVKSPTCIAVNNRFRVFSVGTQNSQVALYKLDEATGVIKICQYLHISTREYPDAHELVGPVTKMAWSPDGYCLAVTWNKTGWSLWSVFGTLLHTYLGQPIDSTHKMKLSHLSWAQNGYMICGVATFGSDQKNAVDDSEKSANGTNETSTTDSNLIVFHMARSALAANPISSNHHHLVLQTPDRVILEDSSQLSDTHHPQTYLLPSEYCISNWPLRYVAVSPDGKRIAASGPNGFVHFNRLTNRWRVFGNVTQERSMHVFGGLAWWKHYICLSCMTENYNASEVRVYCSERKLDNQFSSVCKLPTSVIPVIVDVFDNLFALLTNDGCFRVFQLSETNKYGGQLATLTPCHSIDLASLIIFPACVVRFCLTTLKIGFMAGSGSQDSDFTEGWTKRNESYRRQAEGLLINYAGHLFILQPSHTFGAVWNISLDPNEPMNSPLISEKKPLSIKPTLIASEVELVWSSGFESQLQPASDTETVPPTSPQAALSSDTQTPSYTKDSLWLHCGAFGLRVWLPLPRIRTPSDLFDLSQSILKNETHSPTDPLSFRFSDPSNHSPPGFVSRRIMLSINLDESVYPLSILFKDGMIVGIQNDFHHLWGKTIGWSNRSSKSGQTIEPYDVLPYGVLKLEVQVFLHRIIQQLLRKNLGAHAFQLCLQYRNLPYFNRILELLLHEVLESEATSKTPLPDPLLPQVIAFIQEFPNFLEVIAHCARKTDVAWWPYLFTAIGRKPKDLFELCVDHGNFDTAASFLIILQSSESPRYSWECALSLVRATIKASRWNLTRDLLRFLNAIDPKEFIDQTKPLQSPRANTGSTITQPFFGDSTNYVARKSVVGAGDDLPRPNRLSFSSSVETPPKVPFVNEKKAADDKMSKPQPISVSNTEPSLNPSNESPNPGEALTLQFELKNFLSQLAQEFLQQGHLRKMSELIVNLFEIPCPQSSDSLADWLSKQSRDLHTVKNWQQALLQLHTEFGIPLPQNPVLVEPSDSSSWSPRYSNTPQSGFHKKRLRQARYLLNQLLLSNSYEWACLISLLTLDATGLHDSVILAAHTAVQQATCRLRIEASVVSNQEGKASRIWHRLSGSKPAQHPEDILNFEAGQPTLVGGGDPAKLVLGDPLSRVIAGINHIGYWAKENCPAYSQFLFSFQPNFKNLLEEAFKSAEKPDEPKPQFPLPSSTVISSTDQELINHVLNEFSNEQQQQQSLDSSAANAVNVQLNQTLSDSFSTVTSNLGLRKESNGRREQLIKNFLIPQLSYEAQQEQQKKLLETVHSMSTGYSSPLSSDPPSPYHLTTTNPSISQNIWPTHEHWKRAEHSTDPKQIIVTKLVDTEIYNADEHLIDGTSLDSPNNHQQQQSWGCVVS